MNTGVKALIIAIVVLAAGYYLVGRNDDANVRPVTAGDHKNISYMIDGQSVWLTDGVSETETAPGSATKVVTRYFGNEIAIDLDGDGARDDIAFVLTQERGGTGTFFYAVGAIHTEKGYKGTDGYLLGDRVAPQSTNESQNPRHKNVVVFNYADRAAGEAMAVQPSHGKSAYLKLDTDSMMWAIVEPDFEGESR